MRKYEHSITVTEPSGRVLFQVGGDSTLPDGLSDQEIREQIKASILSELKWDIKLFRTR